MYNRTEYEGLREYEGPVPNDVKNKSEINKKASAKQSQTFPGRSGGEAPRL